MTRRHDSMPHSSVIAIFVDCKYDDDDVMSERTGHKTSANQDSSSRFEFPDQ